MSNSIGRLAFFAVLVIGTVASALAQSGGRVYTTSNSAAGNQVFVLQRNADGTLTPSGSVPTGGLGLGSGLGNQGALAVSQNGRWIAVVNAGDDTVSILSDGPGGPQISSVFASGGVHPISVTWNGDALYVLNDGDAGHAANVRGFRVSPFGTATPIIGAEANLSTATTDPAQVQASPDGARLVVTEKNTNSITFVQLAHDGSVLGVDVQASQGLTPFGFDFDNHGRLFVSEAFGGAPLGSATSSYEVYEGAGAVVVSGSVPTMQTAACWLDVSPDGHWAYVGNAGSGTVSTYRISHDGSIRLAANSSLGAGARALDVVTSPNGRFVHVINSAAGSIVTFQAMKDGSLIKIDEDVLAAGITGISTR